MKTSLNTRRVMAGGIAATIGLAATLYLALAPLAGATEAFAKQTGDSCGQCHTAAKGGGPLTAYGTEFKKNGNKVPKDAGK